MDWKTALDWWPAAFAVLNFLGLWVIWSLSKKFVSAEHCQKCRTEMEIRLTGVEGKSTALAVQFDAAAMRDLALTVATLRARLDGLEDVLERVEHPLRLLLEHHMKGESR